MKALYGVPLLTFSLLFALVGSPAPEDPVTVVVVRHAEKAATGDTPDPELSGRGQERARDLARLLSEAGVTHLFASEFVRTRTTLAPLAEALALEVQVVSARTPAEQLTAIEDLPPGSLAVIAGHSNTVPKLVTGLGGTVSKLTENPQYGPMLGEDEYDRLFILTLPAGDQTTIRTLELRYGD